MPLFLAGGVGLQMASLFLFLWTIRSDRWRKRTSLPGRLFLAGGVLMEVYAFLDADYTLLLGQVFLVWQVLRVFKEYGLRSTPNRSGARP